MISLSEIFKDSIKYPFTNIKFLLILGIFCIIFKLPFISFSLGVKSSTSYMLLLIVSLIVYFIIEGYGISVIRESILMSDLSPKFDIMENFVTGIKKTIVSIIYFIIPAILSAVVAVLTGTLKLGSEVFTYIANSNGVVNTTVNVANNTVAMANGSTSLSNGTTVIANSTTAFSNGTNLLTNASAIYDIVPKDILSSFFTAAVITVVVSLILFIIFGLFDTIAQCRLAKYGKLTEALKINEVVKDISNIGIAKFIGWYILILIICFVISFIAGLLFVIPYIGIIILPLIIMSFVILFQSRSLGLLYSNID